MKLIFRLCLDVSPVPVYFVTEGRVKRELVGRQRKKGAGTLESRSSNVKGEELRGGLRKSG
jgi:hypothetical protein